MRKPLSFIPQQRLTSLLSKGGGITATEAIARASQRLEAIRTQCVDALDAKIDMLAAESAAPASTMIYSLAADIYNLAGTFGLDELAAAAKSLCDLLGNTSGLQGAPRTHEDARYLESVRVHIDALRTLRRPELSGDVAGRKAVVRGLRQVASRTASEGDG